MSKIIYEPAPDVCCIVDAILAQGLFPHIRRERVKCLVSWNTKTRAIARIHGLSSAWIAAGLEPGYVIEVVGERFYRQSREDKVKTIIHELLHIPYTFSGALRPHGRLVNGRRVNTLYRRLDKRALNKCLRGEI